jgi:cell wall assembly regulator SMI1
LIFLLNKKVGTTKMKDIRHLIMTRKPGVNDNDIKLAEEKLGCVFSNQYKELVKLVNCTEVGEWAFHPIKDTKNPKKTWDDIVRQNMDKDVRWQSMPEELITFASDGTGDKLCFQVADGIMQDIVYLWEHETGEYKKLCSSLRDFIINYAEFEDD